jgi:hypothetical protein
VKEPDLAFSSRADVCFGGQLIRIKNLKEGKLFMFNSKKHIPHKLNPCFLTVNT